MVIFYFGISHERDRKKKAEWEAIQPPDSIHHIFLLPDKKSGRSNEIVDHVTIAASAKYVLAV